MPSKRMLFLILQQNKVVLYAEIISSKLARKGFCGAEDNEKLIEKAAVKSVSFYKAVTRSSTEVHTAKSLWSVTSLLKIKTYTLMIHVIT